MHLPHAVGYQNGPPKWWSLPVLAVGLADRGAGDHAPPRRRWARPRARPVDRRALGPGHRAGSAPGRPGHDRLRAGARTGGPSDRVGRGTRRGDDELGSSRYTAAGADAGHRRRKLRRDVVHLLLPANRGGDPDRSNRDRRSQAAAPAGSWTARVGDRVAGVARNRIVVGAEHARLRARTNTPADARPPAGQPVRMDDRAGDRRRRRNQLCDARRSSHSSIRFSPANASGPPCDRADHRRDSRSRSHRSPARVWRRFCSPVRTSCPGLIGQAGTWSLAALAWLLVFKGLAYGLSLGSYRGGPTFPALFLGAAAGIMCSHLPGFPLSAAVPVGMGVAIVAVLRLPLSAVVLATLLTSHAGPKIEPLIIAGVVVAYVVTLVMAHPPARASKSTSESAPAPAPTSAR